MKRMICVGLAAMLASGCTWVKLDEAGSQVRVAYDGRVDGCKSVGEISVSVKDKVGFYERNNLKVKDELETLARNEAFGMKADTIAAMGEPRDGEQRFRAFACGRTQAFRDTPATPSRRDDNAVETFPVKDH
ncbi:DUF4156 domain-containing protein [Tahibacter amnicola]|uniref:DUF4156 domain-containing protein n=1 Tax=Tahibacter amnicola TaxID=2976241 RepID=A0ABY6BF03_9GAMM|nr:DUF4156 domain-containing protein [Tahibacter amnicola]UXI68444.1 DUF4156 domain-containing protein [Tahibacter amnicola]